VYTLQKLYDKALNEYKILIKIDPNDPEGYYGVANYYMTIGKYDLALKNAKEALRLYEESDHPYIKDGQLLLGLIYYYSNDKMNAKIILKKAKDNGAKIPEQLLIEFSL
jgi:tetratricopeptide (TPR) repeat protein